MGHTIYYRVDVRGWREFLGFIVRVCNGLGLETLVEEDCIRIFPSCDGVEPLEIPKKGDGFAKTNLVEPCHSLYLLILHSVAFFGSAELWED